MNRLLKIGVALSSFVAATQAGAAQLIYNFNFQNGNTHIATTTNAGNAIVFSQTIAGKSLSVTATGWNANKSGSNYVIKKATLGDYVGGLGVTSAYDDLTGSACGVAACGTHQIDNFGNSARSSSIDFVQLTFSQAVTLGSISRYAFGTYNSNLNGIVFDDDFSYGKGGSVSNNLALSSTAFAALINHNVGTAGQCSHTQGYCFDASSLTAANAASAATASTTWYVAASLFASYGGDGNVDAFKLAGITAYVTPAAAPPPPHQTSAVPEPASWAMMVMGFGAAGSAMRRRRARSMRSA